jgi:hypothetical protein
MPMPFRRDAASDVLSLPIEDAQRVLKRGVEMLTHCLDSRVSVMCGQSHGAPGVAQ